MSKPMVETIQKLISQAERELIEHTQRWCQASEKEFITTVEEEMRRMDDVIRWLRDQLKKAEEAPEKKT